MILKHAMLALFLALPWSTHADGLYTGAWSYHQYKDEVERLGRDINSNQNLLAYERNSYVAGYFKNSFGYDSVFVAKYFQFYNANDITIGVLLGINYGYRWCGDVDTGNKSPVICPHGIPELRYTKHKLQPALFVFERGGGIAFRWDI